MSRLTKQQLDAALAFNLKQPYTRELWLRVQRRLGAVADGTPGAETASLVAEFQASIGAEINGKVKLQTLATLDVGLSHIGQALRLPWRG